MSYPLKDSYKLTWNPEIQKIIGYIILCNENIYTLIYPVKFSKIIFILKEKKNYSRL